jgi:hypothetical protein
METRRRKSKERSELGQRDSRERMWRERKLKTQKGKKERRICYGLNLDNTPRGLCVEDVVLWWYWEQL